MSERNAEIWSTRLQREILALESTDEDSKKIELLPPFITTIGHTLNIEVGMAKVEFRIDVEVSEQSKKDVAVSAAEEDGAVVGEKGAGDSTGKVSEDGGKVEVKNTAESEKKKDEASDASDAEKSDGTNAEGEGEKDADDPKNAETSTKDETKATDDAAAKKANADVASKETTQPHVVLILDASLYWKPDASTDQTTPMCYPFQKPLAIIKSGSHLFSGGSTIKDGDEVDIDLDWTPSIHLSDAVTNVALKIRECVKRGEPLHSSRSQDGDGGEGLTGTLTREARESLMETRKAMGAMFSSFAAKGSSIAAKGQIMSKVLGESLSALAETTAPVKRRESAEGGGNEGEGVKEEKERKVIRGVIPKSGDEIDLSEEPWNQCVGMYSCKAIRRPVFVEEAIKESSEKQKKEKEVASSGFAGASSMFSRFAQSAKSVMEESFLMITEESIIEFKSNRLNIGSGTVTFAIKIEQMAKLKFRREESLSLFFKQATDDPLVYMCHDSALAVQDIQNVLKRHGVKGKHTNAATQRAVQMALNMVALIQQKEKELLDNPNVNQVNEIMDLYRQAAEKFETAGDPRHAEVMAHMKRFLNQKFTTSILDGTFVKSETPVLRSSLSSPKSAMTSSVPASSVPQGEILEQPNYNHLHHYDDDDDDDHFDASAVNGVGETSANPKSPDQAENDATLKNMDDILEEAKRDMEDFGMGDVDINDILNSPARRASGGDDHDDDAFAELDAMLSDADKELNELLNS